MPRCCVYMCNKIANFRFPSNKLLRTKWIQSINRKNWKPSETTRVCLDHFLPSDFCDTPTSNGSLIRKRQRLKPDAIPSVFAYKDKLPRKVDRAQSIQLDKSLENDCTQSHLNETENGSKDSVTSSIKDEQVNILRPSADSSVTNITDDLITTASIKNTESRVLVPTPSLDHDYVLNDVLLRMPSGYKLFVMNNHGICKKRSRKKVLNLEH